MLEFSSLDIENLCLEDSMDLALQSIVRQNENIIGAYLVSMEGQVIASYSSSQLNEHKVAALGATLISIGNLTCENFQKGEFEHVILFNEKGYLIAMRTGNGMILVVETLPNLDFDTNLDVI